VVDFIAGHAIVGGMAMPLPLYGQLFFGQRARTPVVPGMGSRPANWISTRRRSMHSCKSNRSVLAVRQ
jgi:hypothetical protein